ncbi:hypothetical protein SUDANB105_00588 [Streptomyces sp. enrichment culture]|uniref:hypothetical protein n=1 Tax=Streptomyces sp. enrichment culture TaxID=1795815 RepID=UPI003F54550C
MTTKDECGHEPDADPPGPTASASHTGDSNASRGSVANSGTILGDVTVRHWTVAMGRHRAHAPRVPANWPSRRAVMINEVAQRWVDPQLNDAGRRLTRLIDLPLTVSVRRGPPQVSSDGDDPLSVFRDCQGQMLILGGQGSGKSTLMLRVMRALLDVHDDPDSVVPVPVAVPPDRSAPDDLTAWLVNRVRTYFNGGPGGAVEAGWLLELGLVMPCLEGLDAVAERHLASWETAIRGYLDSHSGLPMMLACQESTMAALRLDGALTGTVRMLPLSGGALDDALAGLGDEGRHIERLLADNPNVREWCTTPLMLSVVGAVDLSRAWDEPPLFAVRNFAYAAGGPLLQSMWGATAQSAQEVREQYAALRRYVQGLLEKPVMAERRRSDTDPPAAAQDEWSRRQLERGLRGLARALREARQDYFDTVGLLAASDPAEARRLGMRDHAPRIRQDLLFTLAMTALVLLTKSYSLAPHVLVYFGWLAFMLWYTHVYGGLLEAPALRWVGRWTHVLPGRPGWPLAMGALSWVAAFCYASWTGLPVGTAAVIGAVMAGAVIVTGCGAGLVKFRVDGTVPPPRRGLPRVATRAVVTGVLLGPVLATAAWWCGALADVREFSPSRWAADAGMAAFCVWTVAGGFALMRHGLDRVQLAWQYHVPWRLSAFLSTAARRGFLVATGSGYRFPHTTIRAAVETALSDPPAADHSPWAARGDTAEDVFDTVLDEKLARYETRRRVAAHPHLEPDGLRARLTERRPALLRDVSALEGDYRELLADARRAEDDEVALGFRLPLVLVWLLIGTSPLWPLFFPGGERVGALAVSVAAGATLFLLAVPAWVVSRPGEEGCSLTVALAGPYLLAVMWFLVSAVSSVLNHFLGRQELGEISPWRVVAVMPGCLVVTALVAVLGWLVGRLLDRLRLGATASRDEVTAAFDAWRTALEHRVGEEVDALVGGGPG